MDEAAAARLFAAMARLADSCQDSAPADDLAASMANLAVAYPPEVHPCFPQQGGLAVSCGLLLGYSKACSATCKG